MDARQYQRLSKRTMNGTGSIDIANFCMGLAGETGEVIDYIKKGLFHGHELDRQKIIDELGDVLWYVSAIATACDDISLNDVLWRNVEKLRARYPDGFSEERSINREVSVDESMPSSGEIR
jgi:NTP pyrophosphatase (non-canonical NTP hydrolase)